MILKAQDTLIVMKLIAIGDTKWSYRILANDLDMSTSEVHAGIKRNLAARLCVEHNGRITPNIRNVKEFMVHGIRYVFIPDRSEITRGMPTGYSAPPLRDLLVSTEELPQVWPDPEGNLRGQGFSPLYKSVPTACRKDKRLYELLALVDGLRGGHAREQKIAALELEKRLESYGTKSES